MRKHTPGPWEVAFNTQDPPEVWGAEGNVQVCMLMDMSGDGAEELANVKLIARAPALLELAERLTATLENILLHQAAKHISNKRMSAADLDGRNKLVAEARQLIVKAGGSA